MIITKTPFRMSFAGGGSDLPSFYRIQQGAVVSTTINKYVYITINKKFDDGIRVAYSKNEEVRTVDQIEHRLVREVMKLLNIDGGIEITTIADIPSKGTGLGSSSSFTVGLINALNAYKNNYISRECLGKLSCEIELNICKEPIGKQDQYAAAYGGFNFIEFMADDSVRVSPIICKPATLQQIEEDSLLFYTGITRQASNLLKQQSYDVAANQDKRQLTAKMVELAYQLKKELESNTSKTFGEILHENWMIKKSLNKSISSDEIDYYYSRARKAGATGGKILGAGAGGFLLVNAPKEYHQSVIMALRPLRRVDFNFEGQGSAIILYNSGLSNQ